jgi:putative transposase
MVPETRKTRGQQIAEKPNQIMRLSEKFYKVASQSGNGMYNVSRTKAFAIGWICDCPDFTYREVKCKHIWAVEFSVKLREAVQPRVIEPIGDVHACIYCHSDQIVRDGLRHNQYGDIQKWNCKLCGRYFTVNIGFERMKHDPQAVTTAMQLYFSGESLRNTAKSLRLIGVEVTHKTVLKWVQKYVRLMEKYLDKITPQVCDTWRADELFLKVKGDMKYLYALMDNETRFWIAQEVADTKYSADIRPLFKQAKAIAHKNPRTLITDGAPNFHEAFMDEYWTQKVANRPEHIRDITLDGKRHNNKMERMNGELRDRERCMRTLEKPDTPILAGMQIYHNYVRPHMGLKGKTPAEVAGISIQGDDKWLTIIQNAKIVPPTK